MSDASPATSSSSFRIIPINSFSHMKPEPLLSNRKNSFSNKDALDSNAECFALRSPSRLASKPGPELGSIKGSVRDLGSKQMYQLNQLIQIQQPEYA